jgi:hypothetical protein
MIAGLNASELLELALMLVTVGALSGFLAGVFGIGGGATPRRKRRKWRRRPTGLA